MNDDAESWPRLSSDSRQVSERLTVMYGVPPYKMYNNTMLETVILMPGLRSLSAGQERRKLVRPKTARDRVGPSSWKSRRDAGEPTSRPLPFFFLPSPCPPRRSLSFVSPSFATPSFFSYQRAHLRFHLSFSSFSLKRRSRPCCPALRSFRIIRSPFFFSHSVLLPPFRLA